MVLHSTLRSCLPQAFTIRSGTLIKVSMRFNIGRVLDQVTEVYVRDVISREARLNFEDEISISGGYCNDPKILTIISKWISRSVILNRD